MLRVHLSHRTLTAGYGRLFLRRRLVAPGRERVPVVSYLVNGNPLCLLTAPLIYSLTVPMALLDLWMTLYQWVCFPVYGLSVVRRRDYFVMDRHRLPYLNGLQKLNCAFCAYANGLIAYVREIAARTEEYWCPIRHSRRVRAAHSRYSHFVPYGDARAFVAREARLRQRTRRRTGAPPSPLP